MSNNFIEIIEKVIEPIFREYRAKLINSTPNKATFSLKNIEISIYLENEFEVYATVLSLNLNQHVYLDEILSDYLNIKEKGTFMWSDRFPMEKCINKITDTLLANVVSLILDEKIDEAINIIINKRKDHLIAYYESIAEKEAATAFKEKRYENVISNYSKIRNLNSVQRKRLEIALTKSKE